MTSSPTPAELEAFINANDADGAYGWMCESGWFKTGDQMQAPQHVEYLRGAKSFQPPDKKWEEIVDDPSMTLNESVLALARKVLSRYRTRPSRRP